MSAFQAWANWALDPTRDGQPYHTTAGDAGGGTAWSITEATWQEATRLGLVHGALKDAPRAVCEAILRALFWDACQCDRMNPGVGGVVFAIAMLDGPPRAARLLQVALGVTVDGVIGPQTLAAANAIDPDALAVALASAEDAFTDGLAAAARFGRGWTRRTAEMLAFALDMIGAPATA